MPKRALKEWADIVLSRLAEASVWIGRCLAYPVHALFRIVARLSLLFATLASIVSAILLALAVLTPVYRILIDVLGDTELLRFGAFLASLGFTGTLVTVIGDAAWARAKELGNSTLAAIKGEWLPGFKVADSIGVTWSRYFVTIPSAMRKSFRSSWKLMIILLAIAVVLLVAWIGHKEPSISEDTHHVIVTPAHEVKPEQVRVYLREGSVFSMLHMEDAKFSSPNSGLGVCLDDAQRRWLDEFRQAMMDCMKEEPDFKRLNCKDGEEPCPVPVLRVTGFASIAPEQGEGRNLCGQDKDKTFNCKVANLRARAVGEFLAYGEDATRWNCPRGNDPFDGASVCPAEHCTGESQHHRLAITAENPPKSRSIGIEVEQWASECQMRGGKPANDGAVPDARRYRVEVLNRAVHIRVLRDFCSVRESTT